MIIFLHGRDAYRSKQGLDKITGEYRKKHADGMSFLAVDAEEDSPKDLLGKIENVVKTFSFFNEKRLVVIRNPFLVSEELTTLIKRWSLVEDKERIIALVEQQNESELNKKDKNFYALLASEPNLVKNFEPLIGNKLEAWIVKELAVYNATIKPEAMKKLIESTAGNSWQISQEIQKLINYGGEHTVITATDVDLLVTPKINLNIFEVVDAVANKNKFRAIKLLHGHLAEDADPYYIFSMIAYQLRNLLRVKDLSKNATPYPLIIKKTGLNPYVVKKTYEQSRKFELEELKQKFAELALMDVKVKNGEEDITDGLYRFALSL